ncbi:MAG: hypothetical protein A2Y58_01695 [Chloroflexi bacterium RBG_13_51_52]|nr:MAG: hypothetical protein A2Y58_01695 [Chloroflexi bacterium RBG_13_51_52]
MWLSIDERDTRPLYLQIINQIKEQMRKGVLKPGDELPSVRELADSLGINMHTVRSAYLKLRDQEIINLRLGRRATIARLQQPRNTPGVQADIAARFEELITDALLMGLSPEEIKKIVNLQMEHLKTV